jgi:hypothetical protein
MTAPDTSPEAVERTYTWNGHTHQIAYPQFSDETMAGVVRMLMRGDLNHESIVCAARDRIMCLVAENDALSTQLTTAHAAGKAEGLREAESYVCSALDALTSGAFDASDPRIEAIAEYAEKLRALPADTPAAKVTVTAQEAARVLLAEWGEHGEGLQGEPACYSLDTDGDLSPDIDGDWVNFSAVTAALRAIAGDKT